MQYLIDTADPNEIEEVMAYGIDGITANTTMYRRQGIGVRSFVARWAERKPSFLSCSDCCLSHWNLHPQD